MTFETNLDWRKEFKKILNKLPKRFIIDSFLVDEESKKIYEKFKNWEIPAIEVVLPSWWVFVYSTMDELESGLKTILDLVWPDKKISFREVSNLKEETWKIVNQMIDNLD